MSAEWTIILVIGVWVALVGTAHCALIPWLKRGPGRDPISGLLWWVIRGLSRYVHRAEFIGLEALRDDVDAGPLIVVSNHTGAIDPLLIQSACRFHIRWMMASEMMVPGLDWLWKQQQLIPVDRDGRDSGPAREAIRHVQSGRAVGIFPEGRIVLPPREIRPFFTGVGLIVARAKAPVLLVWVSGTPDTTSTYASLFTASHARVAFVDLIDFKGERDGHVITQILRRRLAEVTGWPLNDEPMPASEREFQSAAAGV